MALLRSLALPLSTPPPPHLPSPLFLLQSRGGGGNTAGLSSDCFASCSVYRLDVTFPAKADVGKPAATFPHSRAPFHPNQRTEVSALKMPVQLLQGIHRGRELEVGGGRKSIYRKVTPTHQEMRSFPIKLPASDSVDQKWFPLWRAFQAWRLQRNCAFKHFFPQLRTTSRDSTLNLKGVRKDESFPPSMAGRFGQTQFGEDGIFNSKQQVSCLRNTELSLHCWRHRRLPAGQRGGSDSPAAALNKLDKWRQMNLVQLPSNCQHGLLWFALFCFPSHYNQYRGKNSRRSVLQLTQALWFLWLYIQVGRQVNHVLLSTVLKLAKNSYLTLWASNTCG